MKNEITELLNIKYPCIQGGMAWIADASLASAVSNAGGLGLIAAGNAPTDIVRTEIRKTKNLTDKPFGVNIMLMSPYAPEIAEMVCEENIQVVTTGAGNPGKYISMWKEHNIKVIPVVASVALAIRMERNGADAIIAEGCEAGGHIGELTTMTLVPQIVDKIKIPVISAGGIADGRGIAAAFMLGAKGVQMGTRFLAAKECTVHPEYKHMILKAKDIDTIVTGRASGHPVRVIKNSMAREIVAMEKNHSSIEEMEKKLSGSLRLAAKDGDVKNGSIMAGQIAGLINEELPVKEIITKIFDQAEKLLGGKS